MKEVVVVNGVRTAIGTFGGTIKSVSAIQLGSLVIKEVLKKSGLRPKASEKLLGYAPEKLKGTGLIELETKHGNWDDSLKEVQVDEVIMGNVLQAGQGQNTARQATIYAGVSKETSAFTINKVCASGLKAVVLGAQAIQLGQADVVIAGGMESMSNAPYALPKARWGYRMDVTSKGELDDLMVLDGLWETFYGYHMGCTAENIAEMYGITREEQDELGLLSHQRARAAIKDGIFREEIVPVVIPQRKKDPVIFDTDERPMDTSLEKMARLKSVFKKDGTVTAGNASGINDAAAAVLLMSKEKAEQLNLDPWVTVTSYASGAIDPAYMGIGPIPAVKKALEKANLTVKDIDVIELNEAFASQAIACMKELDLSMDKTNPYGSGISLGHPIGCTGARLLVTIAHEMKRKNHKYGLVTMCIGGGQGMAMIVGR
ncbi:MAG: acetyl-CoA C-acetyltransferase [Deltaproteobacteria bacterium]|nr:acetyl-CoA C-acetyltransferase [Deltaproteobacteria bacterium]MBW2184494.1 acetyl-CoA C-acetyltransferase [Deltaproteobacteria bacterium]